MRHRLAPVFFMVLAVLAAPACSADSGKDGRERLFIVGQDLGSVRDYVASGCCPQADGNTAYLNFYNLLSQEGGYGGLGLDPGGQPLEQEMYWGGGPANAWKSATEFGGAFAIGLSITENENPGGLARIATGDYDANIRQLARFVSLIEVPVYLRIGYEFDGSWNQGYADTANYIAAWRRIVNGLREQGAENVQFIWQAAVFPLDEFQEGYHENLADWYPGDSYVDWMGISLFLHLDEKPGVEGDYDPPTARELIAEMLDFARERGKPVMIAEASPQGYDLAQGTNAHIAATWDGPQGEGVVNVSPTEIWDAWFAPVFELMEHNSDVIYALAYINCHWDAQAMWGPPYDNGYWGDTRLQVNPLVAERFSKAIEHWRKLP